MANFSLYCHSFFVPPVLFREEVVMKTSSCFSAQWFLRIRSVYPRSRSRFRQRITQRSCGSGESCSTWSFGKDGNSNRPLSCRKFYQCTATEKLSARIRSKFRTIVKRPETVQTMFWCGFEADRTRTILLYSWYRRRTTDATFMPRIYDASHWKRDSYRTMDSQEYEDRPSLEHKSLLSWWSIQYRSSNTISVSRQYRFLG